MKIVKGSVVVGYVHPNIVTEGFNNSLAKACLWKENKIGGIISSSSPRQYLARNAVIENFLLGPGEWLMWIDTDMTFEHDAIEQLLATAKREKAVMAAGLCFIFERQNNVIKPNYFDWTGKEFATREPFTPGSVMEVDATGSAFVLIHRTVLEATGPVWHQNWISHPASGEPMGHDLAFFYNACITLGFRLVYDTNIEAGHIKHFELDEASFRQYQETTK